MRNERISAPEFQAFDIETYVQRKSDARMTFEYNCDMRRIYPWGGIADTKRPISEFGLVWVEVRPGTNVDAHEHDEEESFLIISGKAELLMEGQMTILEPGDVVYVPRFWNHQMRNPFSETLIFADIYWDDQGRTKAQYITQRQGWEKHSDKT